MVGKVNEYGSQNTELFEISTNSRMTITITVIFFYTSTSIFDKTELRIFIYA